MVCKNISMSHVSSGNTLLKIVLDTSEQKPSFITPVNGGLEKKANKLFTGKSVHCLWALQEEHSGR